MSFGFELDTRGQRELQSYMQQNVATPEQIDENAGPGMFAGTGGLFMSELAAAGRSVAIAGGAIPAAIDAVVGDDNQGRPLADRYFDAVDDVTKSAVEYWKPSPAATGAAGRVLGPVAGGLVELAATGGNPSLMMLRQQLGTAVELVDQGVDATTAQMVGGAQGLATAVGFRLGTVGTSLGAKMASGAAGNLATNVPAAAASQAVLEQGGYTEQAKQFNPFDLEARAIDVLMGAAFGAVARYGPKPADVPAPGDTPPPQTRLLPEERAALLTASSARNWDESAPGRPASDVDLAMHNNAMSAALEQMMRNEPVDVAAHIEGASFMPRADVPEIETMRSDLLAQYDEFARAETPAPTPAVIPQGLDDKRFQRVAYRGEMEGMGRELVDGGGTDLGYAADGTHNGRVSSQNPDWFKNMPDDAKLSVKAARSAIDKALNGKRLGKKEARFISAMMDNVQERREAYARELQANSGELRRQIVEARRQARGEAAAKNVPDYGFLHEEADYIPDANAMERAISDMASEARALGASWDEVFDLVDNKNTFDEMLQGFEQLRAKYENGQADAGTATQRQNQGAAEGMAKEPANKEDPEIAAARAAIERQPEGAMIDLGDEDNPMIVDVRQAWQQVEAEMQQAKKEAEGFMAAVTCYLGG